MVFWEQETLQVEYLIFLVFFQRYFRLRDLPFPWHRTGGGPPLLAHRLHRLDYQLHPHLQVHWHIRTRLDLQLQEDQEDQPAGKQLSHSSSFWGSPV